MGNTTVKRNSYNQIISYTDVDNEYPIVKVPALKSAYGVNSFNKSIDTESTELLIERIDSQLTVINLNTITVPNTLELLSDETTFMWSGEMIQIGFSGGVANVTYYYIENNKYHKLSTSLIINLVAEKLKKPLFFRMDDEYDYNDNPNDIYRNLDYGQHQYVIYDAIGNSPTKMYERKTPGYLSSLTEGDPVKLTDIVTNENDIIEVTFDAENITINEIQPYSIKLNTDTSTLVEFRRRSDERYRSMILKPGEELKYKLNIVGNLITLGDEGPAPGLDDDDLNITHHGPNWTPGNDNTPQPPILVNYTISLIYNNGTTENITFTLNRSSDTEYSNSIPVEYITNELQTVKIIMS